MLAEGLTHRNSAHSWRAKCTCVVLEELTLSWTHVLPEVIFSLVYEGPTLPPCDQRVTFSPVLPKSRSMVKLLRASDVLSASGIF